MNQEYSPGQQAYIDHCKSDPKIAEWLATFHHDSVDGFLANYHQSREKWNAYGARAVQEDHDRLTAAVRQAEEVLYYLQQKKLFDLQCLWRSEQAEVPGVEYSGDFLMLELKIRNLELISPISEADVELLKDYVTDYKWSLKLGTWNGWQDYRSFIDKNEEQDIFGFPTFYNFVCQRLQQPQLWRILPDKRGAKEFAYLTAAFGAKNPNVELTQAEMDSIEDERPYLYSRSSEEAEFAKLFEDHDMQERRSAYYRKYWKDKDSDLEYAIDILENAEEDITVEGGLIWSEAIKQAAFKYQRRSLVAALDVAYENYLFRRRLGISVPDEEVSDGPFLKRHLYFREEILDGREALGEPRDFNF